MPYSAELENLGVLNPVTGDNPAGFDLREDSSSSNVFRAIKDAREEARRIERQAEQDGEEPVQSVTHWRTVRDLSQRALAEQTKDLEISAFLTEALLRTDGFGGLRLGFEISRALVENFWDGLFPLPDEDGESTRVLPLARLNGDLLVVPLNRIPITEARSDGPFACWHHRQAEGLGGFTDEERTERVRRGAVTPEQIHRAVVETSKEFYRQLLDDLEGCTAEFRSLEAALDRAAGSASPPTTSIREALDECLAIVRSITKGMFPDPVDEEGAGVNGEAGADHSAVGATASGGGALKTRDDAFKMLSRVADFFETRDPQSLIAHQIRKVIRMGKMTPAEYFAEMLEDEEARRRLFKSVGIDAPQGENE